MKSYAVAYSDVLEWQHAVIADLRHTIVVITHVPGAVPRGTVAIINN